jgi:hypothetical protein
MSEEEKVEEPIVQEQVSTEIPVIGTNTDDDVPVLPVDDLLTSDPLQLTKAEAVMVGSIANAKSKQEEIENDQVQPIGLYEELSPEDYAATMEEVRKQLIANDVFNEEKNLEKDLLTVPDQNFCVVSWVGPTFRAKTDTCGFRIMGAFKTLEKAQKYAQRLHHADFTYDIGVMEMYLWCLGYPDQSDIIMGPDGQIDIKATEVARDHRLNEFIIKHKTKLEEDKQLFEIRKRAIRKSKITKEADEEHSVIKKVPTGVPTEEMQIVHAKEIEKWLGPSEQKKEDDDDDDYELNVRMLDFETACKIPNQEWAVVSFVGYTGTNQRIPICIKGIYASEEEARNRITQLIHIDDTYDIVPMPLYKWVPCDPDLSSLKTKFKDRQLNDFIEEGEKQKEETLSFHQVRKKYVKPNEEEEEENALVDHVDVSQNKFNIEGALIENKDAQEFEYKLAPAKVRFVDQVQEPVAEEIEEAHEGSKSCAFKQGEEHHGEVMDATNALVEVVMHDSEDIKMNARRYHEYRAEHNEEEPPEDEQTFTVNLTEKDIKEPMFKKANDELKELEEKVMNLMATEGVTEKEARERFRLKLDQHQAKVHELDLEDLVPKVRPKPKPTDFDGMAQKIERLKKEGKTPAEIRKIMSG